MDTQKPIISSKVTTDKNSLDVDADYNYSRAKYYELVDRGSEAIEAMLELATESDNPRSFEVLGRLIKDVADVNEKIITLQKVKKDLQDNKSIAAIGSGTVNNNLFVGSTTELQRLLSSEPTEKEVVDDSKD